MNDTHPIIQTLLTEGYRKMSPTEKMNRVRALTRAVQELALADIHRRHPAADAREQALRLASRWIEPAIMIDVVDQTYSWLTTLFVSSDAANIIL